MLIKIKGLDDWEWVVLLKVSRKGRKVKTQRPPKLQNFNSFAPFAFFSYLLCVKEIKMDVGYRIDLLVEHKVIVEVKSVEVLAPVHFAQLLTQIVPIEIRSVD
jgi:hypothetical protein